MTHFIAMVWNRTRNISEVCLEFRATEVAMKRLRAGNESKGLPMRAARKEWGARLSPQCLAFHFQMHLERIQKG